VVQPTWVEVVKVSTCVAWVAPAVVVLAVEDRCRNTSSVILVRVKSDALRTIRWMTVDIYMRGQCMPVAESVLWIERRGLTAVAH
jgi:hypothetical protein